MKATKFKYSDRNTNLKFRLDFCTDCGDSFEIVENPTIYDNLPNGIYIVRKNSIRVVYWLIDDVWYLFDNKIITQKHGHTNMVDDNNVKMYSETEYRNLSKCFNFLDAKTKQNVLAYKLFLELHFIIQSINKTFLK